jgi:hypothetical protein
MLVFLKNPKGDEDLANVFSSKIVTLLREMSGQDIKIFDIEGSALLEVKYSQMCEITTNSKEEMNKMLTDPKGKEFSKQVSSMMDSITIFHANHEE